MPEADQLRPRTGTRLRAEAPPGMGLVGEEGRKSIGRYEVVKTIGKGAMGVVYKARDPLLDRTVAIKTIMSPQQQGRRVRSAFLERFQREAKAAAKMSHPAIVTIFDVGVDEDSGAPFMVLEYLPGESLADRLDRVRLPLARCVQIGLDLSSALSFAHRQRIVHRDVTPATTAGSWPISGSRGCPTATSRRSASSWARPATRRPKPSARAATRRKP